MAKAIRDVGDLVAAKAEPRAKPLRRARTLAEFWKLHHLPLLETGRPNTLRQYTHRWSYWIEPTFGHLRWSEIDKRRIAAFVISLRKQHCGKDPTRDLLSSGTVINIFAVLSGLITHAVDLDYLDASPCSAATRYLPRLEPAPKNKGKPRAWTLDQTRTGLTCGAIDVAQRAEMAFEIFTCTRRGEAHGLRWACVHLGSRPPWVRIEKSYNGPPKRGGPRELPLHPELVAILTKWRETWECRYGRAPKSDDLVFPRSDDAARMQCSRDVDPMRRATRAAEVPGIGHHGLRHTGATLYREAGLKEEDIAALLGHGADREHTRTRSKGSTQTDLYAPPTMDLLAREISRLQILADQLQERASRVIALRAEKSVDDRRTRALPNETCRAGVQPVQSIAANRNDGTQEEGSAMKRSTSGITMVLPPGRKQLSVWDEFGFPAGSTDCAGITEGES